MGGIPIKGADSQNYTTRTETGADGQETQVVSGIGDWLFRRLAKAMSRLSFDTSNQLRCVVPSHAVTISSGTVSTGNMGMGDMGKPATSMVFSRQLTANSTKRNLIRS